MLACDDLMATDGDGHRTMHGAIERACTLRKRAVEGALFASSLKTSSMNVQGSHQGAQ